MATGEQHDLAGIIEPERAGAAVAGGDLLVAFVDAVLGADDAALDQARRRLGEVFDGPAMADICATVASFNAIVKLADGTGIPLEPEKDERTRELRAELKIDSLRHQSSEPVAGSTMRSR